MNTPALFLFLFLCVIFFFCHAEAPSLYILFRFAYGYNVEYDDLVGYGVFGLIDAIDKYDLCKEVKSL